MRMVRIFWFSDTVIKCVKGILVLKGSLRNDSVRNGKFRHWRTKFVVTTLLYASRFPQKYNTSYARHISFSPPPPVFNVEFNVELKLMCNERVSYLLSYFTIQHWKRGGGEMAIGRHCYTGFFFTRRQIMQVVTTILSGSVWIANIQTINTDTLVTSKSSWYVRKMYQLMFRNKLTHENILAGRFPVTSHGQIVNDPNCMFFGIFYEMFHLDHLCWTYL